MPTSVYVIILKTAKTNNKYHIVIYSDVSSLYCYLFCCENLGPFYSIASIVRPVATWCRDLVIFLLTPICNNSVYCLFDLCRSDTITILLVFLPIIDNRYISISFFDLVALSASIQWRGSFLSIFAFCFKRWISQWRN